MQSNGVTWMNEEKALGNTPTPVWTGPCLVPKGIVKGKCLLTQKRLRKLSGKCESHARFWRSAETWFSSKRSYRVPSGLPVLRDTDPLLLHYFCMGAGGGRGTAQVARHTVTYEQQTNAAHPRILTVTHFSKMKPGDHSQPSCKRLEQDPDNGGQQKNPQQLEKNKMR